MASNNIAFFFLGAAGLTAIGATWGIVTMMNAEEAKVEAEEQRAAEVKAVTVVAASRTLYQGVEIGNDDLFVITIPKEFLPMVKLTEGAGAPVDPKKKVGDPVTPETFQTRERVVGQVPRERILKNEIIRPERLADVNTGVGLNAFVQRGMRALSLDLKGADAVTSFLSPGNYVDILVTVEDEVGNLRTEALMQSVFVLGVNSKAENETDEEAKARGKQKPTVTFMVTPEQAEEMAFAQEMGDVSLSLRNIQDLTYGAIDPGDLNAVLRRVTPLPTAPVASASPVSRAIVSKPVQVAGTPAPAAPAAAAAAGPTIQLIRGGTASFEPEMKAPVEGKTLVIEGNVTSDDGMGKGGPKRK
jgi:Flp pilus assembly protein CpaB